MRAECSAHATGWPRGSAQGYVVTASEGTYFLCVDLKASGIDLDDQTFCRRLVTEFGVAAIPVSAFMTGEDRPVGIVRLCFAKADAVLDEAILRLGRARKAMGAEQPDPADQNAVIESIGRTGDAIPHESSRRRSC
jgi:hypothetical protein